MMNVNKKLSRDCVEGIYSDLANLRDNSDLDPLDISVQTKESYELKNEEGEVWTTKLNKRRRVVYEDFLRLIQRKTAILLTSIKAMGKSSPYALFLEEKSTSDGGLPMEKP